MSQPKERRVVVDVGAIYAQLQALAEEIARLQNTEAQISLALQAVRRAKDSVDAFVALGEGAEVLVPLDPNLNGYGYARIANRDRFIVALGLGYYAEVDASRALEILGSRERSLLEQLSRVREVTAEYTRLYQQYSQVLNTLLASAKRGEG
jgi:prefoldin alpha subunit